MAGQRLATELNGAQVMRLRNLTQAGLWWLLALATLMASAAGLGTVRSGYLPGDRESLLLANAMRSPWLDAAFQGLTWFGSLLVLLPLAMMAAVLLWRRGHRVEARFLIVALIGAAVIARLVKHLVQRPRPDLFPALVSETALSFPSAHALQSAAFAAAVLLILLRLGIRNWTKVALLLGALELIVCTSRVYLQVHYPSDVIAGILAAACWVMGLRVLMFAGSKPPG